MTDIVWRNETRRLGELVPWEHNPKILTKKQADGLRVSLEKFGFAVPFLVSEDGEIYDGHQRRSLMDAMKQYGPDATVDVRVSSRPLTEDERRELVVRLKQNQAGWDFDMLANEWDAEQLVEWGFDEGELGISENPYTGKIESTHYEPSDDLPQVSELYDTDRADAIISSLREAQGLTEDERCFLEVAAQRHIVFDFRRIADYYASASSVMQAEMERSALVIVDIDNAIENGFVSAVGQIMELQGSDYD